MTQFRARPWVATPWLALMFLFAGLLQGCGDSSSDGTTGPGGFTISFTASQTNPGPNSASLSLEQISGNRVTLEVRLTQVTDVFDISFDLVYNGGLLEFSSFQEGDFFNSDGASTSAQAAEAGPGRLVVGVTRLGAVPGISGSGKVISLTFVAQAAGTTGMNFQRGVLEDSNGNVIGGVTWNGGQIRVA